jgi:hypothetical protein
VALFRVDVLEAFVLEAVEALQRHPSPEPIVLASELIEEGAGCDEGEVPILLPG